MKHGLLRLNPIAQSDGRGQIPRIAVNTAALILCGGEQTVDRRLAGSDIRGGRREARTRVKSTGGFRACPRASRAASGRTLEKLRGDPPTKAGRPQFEFLQERTRDGTRQTNHPLS
ncbi:MAG: hypothetical protein LBD06_02260 [Candidatus Accumulibacter sp.]|jgi:hypothetical protein|nr:hypothetical protein [Accumulibacter sp.]